MDPLVHLTFGWHRDVGLALAALCAHQVLAFGVVGGLAMVLRTRRPWLSIAVANTLAFATFLGVTHGLTASTLYGVSVASSGDVTAYLGLLYRPRNMGFRPMLFVFRRGGGPGMLRLAGKEPWHSRGGAEAAYGRASETFSRALATARLGDGWTGPRRGGAVGDAIDRVEARWTLLGRGAWTEPEEALWTVWHFREWFDEIGLVHLYGPELDHPELMPAAPAALRAIGAARTAALADEANAVWGGREATGELTPDQRARMAALDAQLAAAPDDLGALLERYVRAHADEIGQPVTAGAPERVNHP